MSGNLISQAILDDLHNLQDSDIGIIERTDIQLASKVRSAKGLRVLVFIRIASVFIIFNSKFALISYFYNVDLLIMMQLYGETEV
jgi:hypothetical protein